MYTCQCVCVCVDAYLHTYVCTCIRAQLKRSAQQQRDTKGYVGPPNVKTSYTILLRNIAQYCVYEVDTSTFSTLLSVSPPKRQSRQKVCCMYLIDTLKEVWVAVGPLQPCNGHNHFNSLVPNVEWVGGLEVQEPPHGVTDLGPVTGLHG